MTMTKEPKVSQKTDTAKLIEMYVDLCNVSESLESDVEMKESDKAMKLISKFLVGRHVSAGAQVQSQRKLLLVAGEVLSLSGNEAVIRCSMGNFTVDVTTMKAVI